MELSRNRVRILRRIATRKGREAEAVVLLEGPRVVEAALEHGAEILFALHTESSDFSSLLRALSDRGIESIPISSEQFGEFARTETPQGILAIAKEPRRPIPPPERSGSESVLLLDGIQDPGNVGTLIRAATALGVDRIFLLDGTADPWSAKALRASAGLTFRTPLHLLLWEKASSWVRAAGLPLLVAHGPGEDVRSWLARSGEGGGWSLLIGNEGDGPRPEALEEADALLSIPLPEGVESLNAAMAGAILLWALGPGRARSA